MSEKKSWENKELWEEKVTVSIPKATLQADYDEIEEKLGHLILENVIYVNNGWWKNDGKGWGDYITLHVNCNDVFAWAMADGEEITYGEIPELYEMWKKDAIWGPAIWCIKKRNLMPQKPLVKIIKDQGIWDLDSMGLDKNEG